jgi:hypothetical protein
LRVHLRGGKHDNKPDALSNIQEDGAQKQQQQQQEKER